MKRRRNFPSVEGTRRGGPSREGALGVVALEHFLIQDVCRSDPNEFWGHFFRVKTSLFYKH